MVHFTTKLSASLPQAKMTNPHRPFPFLHLPGEIRNMIYSLVFIHPEKLTGRPSEKTNLSSQLLRTCQTVYHEGVSVLYGSNTWSVIIYGGWVNNITLGMHVTPERLRCPRNRGTRPSEVFYKYVRRVHIVVRHFPPHGSLISCALREATKLLCGFRNLDTVRLEYQLPVEGFEFWAPTSSGSLGMMLCTAHGATTG